MSRRPPEREPRIPWSIVLIITGAVLLLTVSAIYLLTPVARPQLPELIPRIVIATPRPTLPNPGQQALLPESPGAGAAAGDATLELPAGPVDAGQPVRLVIPALQIDAPVVEVELEEVIIGGETYFRWGVPAGFAAGWHNDSALLGQSGNTVLNGHHNVHGEIFRDLVNLELGTEVILYDEQRSFSYRVAEQYVLLERGQPLSARLENARWMEPTDDERITFITCWPYTDNSHRVVVVAYPIR